jgi:hypothetical protein
LPFALSDVSEPEPDFAIVPLGDYANEHPATAYFLVEVAHTSLAQDRRKAAIAARAFPELALEVAAMFAG